MDYDFMRSRNRADVELASGLGVTLSLVRMQDCVAAGQIPLGVLKQMDALATQNGDAPEPPPEVLEHGLWIRREMVRRTLRRIAPSLGELTGPDDDDIPMWVVDQLDQDEFDEVAGYALRDTPLPAGSPA